MILHILQCTVLQTLEGVGVFSFFFGWKPFFFFNLPLGLQAHSKAWKPKEPQGQRERRPARPPRRRSGGDPPRGLQMRRAPGGGLGGEEPQRVFLFFFYFFLKFYRSPPPSIGLSVSYEYIISNKERSIVSPSPVTPQNQVRCTRTAAAQDRRALLLLSFCPLPSFLAALGLLASFLPLRLVDRTGYPVLGNFAYPAPGGGAERPREKEPP